MGPNMSQDGLLAHAQWQAWANGSADESIALQGISVCYRDDLNSPGGANFAAAMPDVIERLDPWHLMDRLSRSLDKKHPMKGRC